MARSVLALLALALLGSASGQGFLHHLPNIQPQKIVKESPAQIAKDAAKKASDAAKKAEEAAAKGAADPAKAAEAAKSAVTDAKPQEEAAKALDKAGDAMKHAAGQAGAANASAVAQGARHAADAALPKGLRPEDVERTSKGELADTVRKVTPKAAQEMGHMGHEISREAESQSSRAADFVNRTGHAIADRIFGPIPEGSTGLPPAIEEKVRAVGVAPILGCLLALVLGGAVVASRRSKGRARSPVLLGANGEAADELGQGTQMMSVEETTSFSRF